MDLDDAKTVQDVMGILDHAQTVNAYARKHRAAIEAQSACMVVVLLAEARIGAEIIAAQARGELATQAEHGRSRNSVRTADTDLPASLPDIGIPRQRAAEMKQLAAAGADAINAEVAAAKSEGRRPSRKKVLEKAKAKAKKAKPARQLRPPVINDRLFAVFIRIRLLAQTRKIEFALASEEAVRGGLVPG